jgi:hypothetical protein
MSTSSRRSPTAAEGTAWTQPDYPIERTAVNLVGRWRIIEMDLWDRDAIEQVGLGFLEFRPDGIGSFGFVAVEGWMDCRPVKTGSRPGVEFTWDGTDAGDRVSGRGAATLQDDGSLHGHIYFHLGEDSGFRAERVDAVDRC